MLKVIFANILHKRRVLIYIFKVLHVNQEMMFCSNALNKLLTPKTLSKKVAKGRKSNFLDMSHRPLLSGVVLLCCNGRDSVSFRQKAFGIFCFLSSRNYVI